MKPLIALASLALFATHAQALPSDVKTLAQFDLGYARCEIRFEHMRGHGDEAYLALWKVKPDAKRKAELAKVRKSAAYQRERTQAQQAMSKDGSPELEAKLKRQCEGTWAEAQRNAPAGAAK